MNKKENNLFKLIKKLRSYFPVLFPLMIICIIFNALISSIPSIFMQNVIKQIQLFVKDGDWSKAQGPIMSIVWVLIALYVFSIISGLIYQQLGAHITQGFLSKLRIEMFEKMQKLPIKFFDTRKVGDIMSYYTNDIETLRQLVSQSLPSIVSSSLIVVSVFSIMMYYSIWLLLIIIIGIIVMTKVTKYLASNAAKNFKMQQTAIAKQEAFIQEMMNGQKVIKVFNHEDTINQQFDEINDELCSVSTSANKYAMLLMPILHNIGNILYVIIAVVGSYFIIIDLSNLSISGLAFDVSILVPFLSMTKQFTGNIQTVSQQFNSIIMAIAGAGRIFELLNEEDEIDEGHIELVNVVKKDGKLIEVDKRSDLWAWKDNDKLIELEGDVRFNDVVFGYDSNKIILNNISLYAKPHQKLAFVGATGAGKTTITNLINRFYDIQSGTITYDGINIKDIKKNDLRRSLGIVLQDTNLFTSTVIENIRYSNPDASDDECIISAKLAGAHDFIERLPNGYNTIIHGKSDGLSQGQKQLIAIARAACSNPPVMILDEATSSIDTRTESIVQQGMDALMINRTVFVIAHRLSTVQNSDAIIVLDHGTIIERGSHNSLLEQKGKYYQLYTGAFELE